MSSPDWRELYEDDPPPYTGEPGESMQLDSSPPFSSIPPAAAETPPEAVPSTPSKKNKKKKKKAKRTKSIPRVEVPEPDFFVRQREEAARRHLTLSPEEDEEEWKEWEENAGGENEGGDDMDVDKGGDRNDSAEGESGRKVEELEEEEIEHRDWALGGGEEMRSEATNSLKGQGVDQGTQTSETKYRLKPQVHDRGTQTPPTDEQADPTKLDQNQRDTPASAPNYHLITNPQKPDFSRTISKLTSLRVNLLLLQAAQLLSRPQTLTAHSTSIAQHYARRAHNLASSDHSVPAVLRGRCAYYLGLAEFLMAGEEGRAGNNEETKPCLELFEQACGAKGVYEEGKWAEEWVDYFSKKTKGTDASPAAAGSPLSPGGWVRRGLRALWGGGGTVASPTDGKAGARKSSIWRFLGDSDREMKGEAIPDFSPIGSEEGSLYSPKDTDRRELFKETGDSQTKKQQQDLERKAINDPSTPIAAKTYTPLMGNGSARSSSVDNPSSTSTLHTRGKLFIQEPEDLRSDNKNSIYDKRHRQRRQSSLSALFTGRSARQPSEVDLMEEGESPYRATFEVPTHTRSSSLRV